MKEGLKPSLATTHAKVSRRVIATLWAGKTCERMNWGRLFGALIDGTQVGDGFLVCKSGRRDGVGS